MTELLRLLRSDYRPNYPNVGSCVLTENHLICSDFQAGVFTVVSVWVSPHPMRLVGTIIIAEKLPIVRINT